MKRTNLLAGLLFVLTFLSAQAFGCTVEVAYVGLEAGGREGTNLNGEINSGANGLLALKTRNPVGSLAELIDEKSWGYCYELTQYAEFNYRTYNVARLESVTGSCKAELISQLWAQHYDKSWESESYIYYGGNQGGWDSGEPANTQENREALALSFAIYEIIYDFDGSLGSLDLAADCFKAREDRTDPDDSIAIAANWLNSLVLPCDYTGPLAELLSLRNNCNQDFIVEIPEPATICILGLASLMLVKKRKS
jgi:hypothetical protein